MRIALEPLLHKFFWPSSSFGDFQHHLDRPSRRSLLAVLKKPFPFHFQGTVGLVTLMLHLLLVPITVLSYQERAG